MIDQLTTVTSAAVGVALDALAQRQQLIAANLANVNSAGYAIRDVQFEETFARALTSAGTPAETVQAMLRLKQDVNDGVLVRQSDGQAAEMDTEMLRLNETVIRYQALVEGLGKYGSLARMAITGEVGS